jgi:hypothetical protein
MPQKHGQVGQRKRRATGHKSSRAEIRNQSAYGKLILNKLSNNLCEYWKQQIKKSQKCFKK